ncbi:MAG: hypothetical protein FWH11_12025 [Micrococcales bacterium]|nr:hypothetical protein [Micrococcales bacterium]
MFNKKKRHVYAAEEPVENRPRFEEVWPESAGTLPAVVDDAELIVTQEDSLCFDLALPDHPAHRFQVRSSWGSLYLRDERQCLAWKYLADEPPPTPEPGCDHIRKKDRVWLCWDDEAGRLAVSRYRNREDRNNSVPLHSLRYGISATPPSLSTSLVAVAVAMLVDGERLVIGWVREEQIGSATVRIAVSTLLAFPAVDPAKLIWVLERHPETLPTLWPLLAEPVRVAGTTEGPVPTWLNRVLDVALLYADHLREAARRGLIPEDAAAWPGLAELAARPGKSAALAKARSLLAAVRDGGRR